MVSSSIWKKTGNLVLRQGVRIAGDELVGCRIVASLRARHLYIEHGIVHLSHNSLATRKHWGFGMVEERKPQVDVLPLGPWSLM